MTMTRKEWDNFLINCRKYEDVLKMIKVVDFNDERTEGGYILCDILLPTGEVIKLIETSTL